MLLIDDEADHASINTKKKPEESTAINIAIRELLSLFPRSSFVGYTATPFANIFIDPDSEREMTNGQNYADIFPRHFVACLDPPDNYVGPSDIFPLYDESNVLLEITDNQDEADDKQGPLPLKHKKDFIPEMPDSLEESMCCFILGKTIRVLRGQADVNHSMMVNASRFIDVQVRLSDLIREKLKSFKQNINNYAALKPEKALANCDLSLLHEVWQKEFKNSGQDWPEVQSALKSAVDPMEVLTINSKSTDTLNYDRTSYPNGRTVIAVGGISLSRGLTLEGLMTSYFLRNSVMYDTLMQMGRWFGYRDGYADLCRIYMTPLAITWYTHIADATHELGSEFKAMERAKLTPEEFGLRIRSHPDSLIVTARNKMRTGRKVARKISLQGRLAETSVVHAQKELLQKNRSLLEDLIAIASKKGTKAKKCPVEGHLWENVPTEWVIPTLEKFENHPQCVLTSSTPIIHHLKQLISSGTKSMDVLLRSVNGGNPAEIAGFEIGMQKRTVSVFNNSKFEFSKRRVASRGDEKAGLAESQIRSVEDAYDGDNVPDKAYRKVPGRNPLFMVHFVDIVKKGDDSKKESMVPAYGISFPGDPGDLRRPEILVEYIVNTTWWKENYGYDLDENYEDDIE